MLGGARNLAKEAEMTTEFGVTTQIQERLVSFLKEVILPDQPVKIAQCWSGILGIGEQKSPIVKMYSDRVGVAVRLGGMGVAIGSLVGAEGARLFY